MKTVFDALAFLLIAPFVFIFIGGCYIKFMCWLWSYPEYDCTAKKSVEFSGEFD